MTEVKLYELGMTFLAVMFLIAFCIIYGIMNRRK